jgi:hypothetical protein
MQFSNVLIKTDISMATLLKCDVSATCYTGQEAAVYRLLVGRAPTRHGSNATVD